MQWLPIKNYEGLYEVSNTGLVRSLDRNIKGKDGIWYPFKGKIKQPMLNKKVPYLQVSLYKNNVEEHFYVHRLVANAFIPNPKNLPEVNHRDGNKQNNSVDNLEWVTSQENKIHAIKTKLRIYNNRLTKAEFIHCLMDVINGESYYSLSQRTPYKVPFLSVKLRRFARELGLEGELNESLKLQRIKRSQLNGSKHKRIAV